MGETAKYAVFRSRKTGELYGITLEKETHEMDPNRELHGIVMQLLDIMKLQQNMLDSLQRQINIITGAQKPSQGLAELHKIALGLPEGASKTGEGEDEDVD